MATATSKLTARLLIAVGDDEPVELATLTVNTVTAKAERIGDEVLVSLAHTVAVVPAVTEQEG